MASLVTYSGALAQAQLGQTLKVLSQPNLINTPVQPHPIQAKIIDRAEPHQLPNDQNAVGNFVGAISVEGAHDIEASKFGPAIEPYVGRTLNTEDMSALCHAVADIARARGYSFASAYVPPQALSLGVLTVMLDEGLISEVRMSGSHNKQLKRIFHKLVGHAVTAAETEKQAALAADIPGIAVQSIGFIRENERGILLITATEKRISGAVVVDNSGSKSQGPARITVAATVSSMLRDGDAVNVAVVTTPLKPKELAFAVLKYELPLDADGTVLSASAALGRTQPGGDFADYDIHGKSLNIAVAIKRPLVRSRKTSLWLGGGIEYLNATQSILGLPFNQDHLTTLWLSLNGETELLRGRLRGEVTVTQGLPIFNGTEADDPFASRAGADSAFTKVRLSGDWTGQIYRSVSMRLSGVAQFASGPLLSAQQIGVGGPSFGRAYEYSERSGDNGVLGLAEVRVDFNQPTKWLDWVQPYVFVDGGKVKALQDDTGSGTLLSGGGGLRTRFGKTFLNFESAFPLNEDRAETNDRKPRLNVQLIQGF
jgi:hemolysin activation/secretion protein